MLDQLELRAGEILLPFSSSIKVISGKCVGSDSLGFAQILELLYSPIISLVSAWLIAEVVEGKAVS